jgi:hypothetical protein
MKCKHKPGPRLEDPALAPKAVTLYLDARTKDLLQVLGKGKGMSRGARVAARVAYRAYQKEPPGEPGEKP